MADITDDDKAIYTSDNNPLFAGQQLQNRFRILVFQMVYENKN